MDFRTPCQIILGFLLAATALSVLGLAADNASYIDHHRNDSPVNVHYTPLEPSRAGAVLVLGNDGIPTLPS